MKTVRSIAGTLVILIRYDCVEREGSVVLSDLVGVGLRVGWLVTVILSPGSVVAGLLIIPRCPGPQSSLPSLSLSERLDVEE